MQAGTERPRFREDLLAEAIDEQGAKFIDVMDPDSGTVFRFYESEFSLACGMDGERDVPGIVQWAKDELGLAPTVREVQTVIATLGELGYLDMAAASRAAAADVPEVAVAAAVPAAAEVEITPRGGIEAPAAVAAAAAAAASARAGAAGARAPAAGSSPEVSLDLTEHLAVGREDVQEAVRQSRVMAAVEVPPELAEPSEVTVTPPEPPVARPPERPIERPVEVRQPAPAIEVVERPGERPGERPIERPVAVTPSAPVIAVAPPPERPVERLVERPLDQLAAMRQSEPVIAVTAPVTAEHPIAVKQPEVVRPPIELPKVPEKQPAPPPVARPGRTSTLLVVLLVLVVLGIAGFLVWKFLLGQGDATIQKPVSVAPVTPQPPPPAEPPGPPPRPTVTSKIELASGRPKTILALFPGVIEWIETAGKEVKSNDIVMKLQGHKALEAQVAALTKEVEKLQAEVNAAYKARDAVQGGDEAALKKAQAKVDAVDKAYTTKSDQLLKKTDQLEPYYVRLTIDGTITAVMRKAGEKISENTQLLTILPVPVPSATFKIPPDVRVEVGSATALKAGEKVLTCDIADSEPEMLRITCPDSGATPGTPVTWELP